MAAVLKINYWLERHGIMAALVLFCLSLAFFSWIQDSPTLLDPDGFYHIRAAAIISEQGVIADFPYLPFTTLNDDYIDHHLLYHLLLVPFISWLPPFFGAKLLQALLASLVVVGFFLLLKAWKITGAWWYAYLLLLTPAFVFRMSLLKSSALSVLILLAGFYALNARRRWLLFLLAWLYAWSYGGWFLLSLAAGFQTAAIIIDKVLGAEPLATVRKVGLLGASARLFRGCFDLAAWSAVFGSILGALAGLVSSPYFPQNLSFYWLHIVQIALINAQSQIAVGAEWYPYNFGDLIKFCWAPVVLALVAVILFFAGYRRMTVKEKWFFVLLLFFFLATSKSRRNVEYLAPLGLLFAAVVFSRFALADERAVVFGQYRKKIKDFYADFSGGLRIFLAAALIIVVGCVLSALGCRFWQMKNKGLSLSHLSGAVAYLQARSQPAEVVFHNRWDDFPSLFYYNKDDYYIIGLDPSFLYFKDRAHYQAWLTVSLGLEPERDYAIVKEIFGAGFVLIDKGQSATAMLDNFNRNQLFSKVYEDPAAVIFKTL